MSLPPKVVWNAPEAVGKFVDVVLPVDTSQAFLVALTAIPFEVAPRAAEIVT